MCKDKETTWKKYAEKLGLQVRGEYGESLANPEYGTDCAQAQEVAVRLVENPARANRQQHTARQTQRLRQPPDSGVTEGAKVVGDDRLTERGEGRPLAQSPGSLPTERSSSRRSSRHARVISRALARQ